MFTKFDAAGTYSICSLRVGEQRVRVSRMLGCRGVLRESGFWGTATACETMKGRYGVRVRLQCFSSTKHSVTERGMHVLHACTLLLGPTLFQIFPTVLSP